MPRDSQEGVVFEAIEHLQPATLESVQVATGLALSTIRRHVRRLCAAGRLARKRADAGKNGRPPELYTPTGV